MNALYDKGRQGFLEADIDWTAIAVRAVLVDTGAYTPDLETDKFLSDIPTQARVSTSGDLTGKTAAAGVADAHDLTFAQVTGPTTEALVIFQWTGNPNTSRLIAYIDDAAGLPLSPNGGDVTIVWDDGPNKIFKI